MPCAVFEFWMCYSCAVSYSYHEAYRYSVPSVHSRSLSHPLALLQTFAPGLSSPTQVAVLVRDTMLSYSSSVLKWAKWAAGSSS